MDNTNATDSPRNAIGARRIGRNSMGALVICTPVGTRSLDLGILPGRLLCFLRPMRSGRRCRLKRVLSTVVDMIQLLGVRSTVRAPDAP